MVEAESLISDIKTVLENQPPWYLEKRPYYDPHRILQKALDMIESLLEDIEDLEQEVNELRDSDRGFS